MRAMALRRISRPGCWAGIITLSLLALIELLFDPVAWIRNVNSAAQTRAALPLAADRWRAHGIEDYDIQVKGFVPLSCMMDAVLSVRKNELVAVRARQIPWDETAPWEPVPSENWDLPFCSYRQLTVTGMFEKVGRGLVTADLSVDALEVQFDPAYGFVTSYDYRSGYRQGLFNPVLTECCVWYAFSQFQPFSQK